MIHTVLMLILSMAMLFFYFQATCEKILRRHFDREYFQSIAKAIRLEFPSLRKSLEEFHAPVDYSQLSKTLHCDFLALTYLLQNVANSSQGFSWEERLLVLYFRWQFLSSAVRRLLKVGENKAILRQASVLQYFANVVGQRLNALEFGN